MTRIRLPAWLKEVYGKINKGAITFRRWKGRIVLEVDPSPSYTRTALQDSIRKFFKNCIKQWYQLSEAEKEQYNQEARKYNLTGYQYFIKQCMSQWTPAPERYIEITITEQSGNDLMDYQVLLNVENDPSFFDFVQDPTYIEIYDSDKTTPLSFYVEEWDDTNHNARIWIKIPNIPANGTKKVYLYSNPSRTTPLSDPTAVFDFFDDFEGDSLDSTKWHIVKIYSKDYNYVSVSVSDSKLIISVSSDRNRAGPLTLNYVLNKGQIAEAEFVSKSSSANIIFTAVYGYQPANSYEIIPIEKVEELTIWELVNDSGTKLYGGDPDTLPSYPYIALLSNGIIKFGTREQGNLYSETSNWDKFMLGFYSYTEGTIEVDWVRVRKYTEPEPSVSYTILT